MPILTPEERVGTMLAGRYRIEGILGHGGTSTVFEAIHTYTNRRVALKLLKPEHARDRELVMRFLTEARTASTLVHPNVVAILDMGVDPQGDVYLVMELVRGEPLGAMLEREGTLDAERALELLMPVMGALALAHERRVIHRDVKPDNILIGDRGDGVIRPILLDFGMAKMVEAAWGHATQSGVLVGTPFYMSPEQAEGASDIDAATDVWSMGVVLYRCIGGALPFFGASPTALLLAIVRGEHEALAARAPEAPPLVLDVIERALRVSRSERFATMREMIEAFDDARSGKGLLPLPASAASAPSRAPYWAASIIAATALLSVAAWTLLWGDPAPAAPPITLGAPEAPAEPTSAAVERVAEPPPEPRDALPLVAAPAPPEPPLSARVRTAPEAADPAPPPEEVEPAPEIPARRPRGIARAWRGDEPEREGAETRPGLATEW